MSVRLLIAVVVLAACVPADDAKSSVEQRAAAPTTDEPAVAGPSRVVWRYAQTLLLPADPNAFANVLLDVEPLRDGGWVVVQDRAPVRQLPQPKVIGGFFIPNRGMVMRLNASGTIVATAGDSFEPTQLVLFESAGVVVAQGAGTRGLDLQSLGTLWSTDEECVAIGDRCYAYQPNVLPPPGTIEVREPRTFSLVDSLSQVKVGQLTAPMILPQWNLAIVRSSSPDHSFDFFPLDRTAAIALPWIEQLRKAKSISLLSADRALVSYEGWDQGRFPKTELIDIPTGRVITAFGNWVPVFANRAVMYLQGPSPLQVLDPRDGAAGPTLPALPLYVDLERELIVVPLGNGGAAVLRRETAPGAERAIPVKKIAEGHCTEIEFTRVQLADGTAGCADLSGAAGPRRVLVSLGREGGTDSFEITRIAVDEAARRLTINVKVGGVHPISAPQGAPTQIIEFPADLGGRWLVGLEPEPATPRPFGFATAFALDLH